jgi:CNT family concentrative nucleoside transporter
MQVTFAFFLLKFPVIQNLLLIFNEAVIVLETVTLKATQFMFGYLAGAEAPFEIKNESANFIVAFRVLPLVLFISALSSVLFHLGVLPFIIKMFSKVFSKVFRLGGVLSFSSAATIFLGTIEAPLVVKPYLKKLNDGELLALISCSMATIAGTVMVLYASVLGQVVAVPVGHMVTASLMSIPSALLFSHLIDPSAVTSSPEAYSFQRSTSSVLEALIHGITDGLQMVLQIVAIIIVLFAFVYLGDHILKLFVDSWSIEKGLGFVIQPFVWLMGIPWEESLEAARLMASKIVLNEFVAYLKLSQMADSFSEQSRILLTYCMCGFANFASAGIIIGGLNVMIPERSATIGRLAVISIFIGNIATMTTAAVVNLIH